MKLLSNTHELFESIKIVDEFLINVPKLKNLKIFIWSILWMIFMIGLKLETLTHMRKSLS